MSSHDPMRGATSPAIRERIVMTTSNSRSVIPAAFSFESRRLFPANHISILAFTAGATIRPKADNVRLVAMVPRVFVNVGISPGVEGNFFWEVRPIPIASPLWRRSQCLQALLSSREFPRVKLVCAQRGLESGNLGPGCRDFGLPNMLEKSRHHEPCEKTQDDNDDDQFNQGKARVLFRPSAVYFFFFEELAH